jgi:hypothetical protein
MYRSCEGPEGAGYPNSSGGMGNFMKNLKWLWVGFTFFALSAPLAAWADDLDNGIWFMSLGGGLALPANYGMGLGGGGNFSMGGYVSTDPYFILTFRIEVYGMGGPVTPDQQNFDPYAEQYYYTYDHSSLLMARTGLELRKIDWPASTKVGCVAPFYLVGVGMDLIDDSNNVLGEDPTIPTANTQSSLTWDPYVQAGAGVAFLLDTGLTLDFDVKADAEFVNSGVFLNFPVDCEIAYAVSFI